MKLACPFNIVSVFALVLLVCASAIQIDLFPGDRRCIGQELDQLEPVIFATSASSKVKDPKQKLALTVTDPEDASIINEKISIGSKLKETEHKVATRGLYELCYELSGGKTPVRVFFHVDYKPLSVDGQDKSRKIMKDDIPTLESELQIIGEKIKDISTEIEHARRQELYLKEAGDVTASRIQWFSILSIVILVGTSLWQLIYLRRFFAVKKLL